MTFSELEKLVRSLSYKPDSIIESYTEPRYGTSVIRITQITPNSDGSPGKAPIISSLFIEKKQLKRLQTTDVISMLEHRLKLMEFHEIKEWFKYKGKHVTEPHHEQNLDTISQLPKPNS